MTINTQLSELTDAELIDLYPSILKELKTRGIIRTNNLIGELGEHLAARRLKDPTKAAS